VSKAAERLLAAAIAYGDACSEQDRAIRAWKQGDPPTPVTVPPLHRALDSAARAYATATRPARKRESQT
jgi:hypothetical protein